MNLNCDLNILQYWKSHEYQYLELLMMARDILIIPISTVASESAFSIEGRVLDPYRSSLAPKNVEVLTTRDWLFGSGGKKKIIFIWTLCFLIKLISFFYRLL